LLPRFIFIILDCFCPVAGKLFGDLIGFDAARKAN